jgi:hypothetical protein
LFNIYFRTDAFHDLLRFRDDKEWATDHIIELFDIDPKTGDEYNSFILSFTPDTGYCIESTVSKQGQMPFISKTSIENINPKMLFDVAQKWVDQDWDVE